MLRGAFLILLAIAGVCIVAAFIFMCLFEPDDPRLPDWLRDRFM